MKTVGLPIPEIIELFKWYAKEYRNQKFLPTIDAVYKLAGNMYRIKSAKQMVNNNHGSNAVV